MRLPCDIDNLKPRCDKELFLPSFPAVGFLKNIIFLYFLLLFNIIPSNLMKHMCVCVSHKLRDHFDEFSCCIIRILFFSIQLFFVWKIQIWIENQIVCRFLSTLNSGRIWEIGRNVNFTFIFGYVNMVLGSWLN